MSQENGKPGWNGQIFRKVLMWSPKTEPGRNRKYEETNHKCWNWNCDWKKKKKAMFLSTDQKRGPGSGVLRPSAH